ncbi:MAG: hypothetical protein ACTHMA_21310, partial [Thermomicrobiales bacterium]
MINGAARQFLSIYGPAVGDDLVHIAQGIPERQLRTLIDHIVRTKEAESLDEIAVEDPSAGSPRYLQIIGHPQSSDGEHGPLETVMLIITNITPTVQRRHELERRRQVAEDERDRVQHAASAAATHHEEMVGRLVETNRQLVEANQGLTAANEELRTT